MLILYKMVNYYMQALKQWNAESGEKWCIPKKGTTGYNEVMRLKEMLEQKAKKKEKKNQKAKSKKALKRIQSKVCW